jgi:serine/threonine protein kinase
MILHHVWCNFPEDLSLQWYKVAYIKEYLFLTFCFPQQKIADFGLATQLSRADEKHLTMCGTPNYISPEVT